MMKKIVPPRNTDLSVHPLNRNDPYQKKLGDLYFRKVPHSIYFYYVQLGVAHIVRHYYYSNGDRKIDWSDLPEIIRMLGRNVTEEYEAPPCHGLGFYPGDCTKIAWKKKSYFVILLDNDPLDAQFAANNAVTFKSRVDMSSNYSFFDAQEIVVDLSEKEDGTRLRKAFACINHMKKHGSPYDIGIAAPENECYDFSMNVSGQVTRLRGYRTPDSGGTNMGPPVPPPTPI